nr:hypothetical protein [Pseudopedobacter sp.]
MPFSFEGNRRIELAKKCQLEISHIPFINYYQYEKDFGFMSGRTKIHEAYELMYKKITGCIKMN